GRGIQPRRLRTTDEDNEDRGGDGGRARLRPREDLPGRDRAERGGGTRREVERVFFRVTRDGKCGGEGNAHGCGGDGGPKASEGREGAVDRRWSDCGRRGNHRGRIPCGGVRRQLGDLARGWRG